MGKVRGVHTPEGEHRDRESPCAPVPCRAQCWVKGSQVPVETRGICWGAGLGGPVILESKEEVPQGREGYLGLASYSGIRRGYCRGSRCLLCII